MNALAITIPVSLLLVAFFVAAFIFAVRRDQFEDLLTPAHRILLDDEEPVISAAPHNGKDGSDVRERSKP
jgi:cbb3-type cytochrome oxidase maturation protein